MPTLDGFAAGVGQCPGIGLGDLTPLVTVVVTTANSAYRFIVLDPAESRVLIQGGRFFAEPTEARLVGATLGGSLLKVSWVAPGLRMEIQAAGQRIVTSSVRSVDVRPEVAPS